VAVALADTQTKTGAAPKDKVDQFTWPQCCLRTRLNTKQPRPLTGLPLAAPPGAEPCNTRLLAEATWMFPVATSRQGYSGPLRWLFTQVNAHTPICSQTKAGFSSGVPPSGLPDFRPPRTKHQHAPFDAAGTCNWPEVHSGRFASKWLPRQGPIGPLVGCQHGQCLLKMAP